MKRLWDKRVLLGIVLVQLFIIISFLFTNTDVDSSVYETRLKDLEQTVDSLSVENEYLQNGIETMLLQASQYEEEVGRLTNKLETIRRGKNEKINSVDSYKHSELERFFSDRYKDSID